MGCFSKALTSSACFQGFVRPKTDERPAEAPKGNCREKVIGKVERAPKEIEKESESLLEEEETLTEGSTEAEELVESLKGVEIVERVEVPVVVEIVENGQVKFVQAEEFLEVVEEVRLDEVLTEASTETEEPVARFECVQVKAPRADVPVGEIEEPVARLVCVQVKAPSVDVPAEVIEVMTVAAPETPQPREVPADMLTERVIADKDMSRIGVMLVRLALSDTSDADGI